MLSTIHNVKSARYSTKTCQGSFEGGGPSGPTSGPSRTRRALSIGHFGISNIPNHVSGNRDIVVFTRVVTATT
ncbi:unnamed protein product [Adineta steineri]|uniref:Uncharacterized protein n=1 Tax=Adineta steineri TaxID=433720 RepID=A0A819U033_9BILA|nr:unnamed protein product [Adineta steineri]CAF4087426.1 unnamed protein product [Adineta steineri]